MAKTIITSITIFLLAFSVFGLATMDHMGNQGHGSCPFIAAGVNDCARIQNPLSFISLHINALAKFFSAIQISGTTVLSSLILYLSLGLLTFNKDFLLPPNKFLFARVKNFEPLSVKRKILFQDWLSRHENSPTYSIRRT